MTDDLILLALLLAVVLGVGARVNTMRSPTEPPITSTDMSNVVLPGSLGPYGPLDPGSYPAMPPSVPPEGALTLS